MTRRPRSTRPPRLDPPQPARDASPRVPPPPTARRLLVEARVAGPHARFGRAEISARVGEVTAGRPEALLGLDLGRVERDEAQAAVAACWGYDGVAPRGAIAPERTLDGAARAAERLHAVAVSGGRVALVTGRPASLLGVYRALAGFLAAAGAEVLAFEAFGPFAGGRSLWWVDGVAVVTDGLGILADDGIVAGPEWCFAVGRPELVVADRGFAGAAVAEGLETVAFADLDAVALGVAARRGRPVRLVPLDERRPPEAYLPIVGALTAPGPHSTTPAPPTYAGPESGGEG